MRTTLSRTVRGFTRGFSAVQSPFGVGGAGGFPVGLADKTQAHQLSGNDTGRQAMPFAVPMSIPLQVQILAAARRPRPEARQEVDDLDSNLASHVCHHTLWPSPV